MRVWLWTRGMSDDWVMLYVETPDGRLMGIERRGCLRYETRYTPEMLERSDSWVRLD